MYFILENNINLLQYILKIRSVVLFYALLFASSCRSKRNHPAAITERYFGNSYITQFEAMINAEMPRGIERKAVDF